MTFRLKRTSPTQVGSAPLILLEHRHHRCLLALPAGVPGQWCELRIEKVPPDASLILIVRSEMAADLPDPWTGATVTYAGTAIFGVAEDATALTIDVFGLQMAAEMRVLVRKISRAAATFKLLAQSPWRSLAMFRHQEGAPHRRLRSLLIALAAGQPRWLAYTVWHRVFDRWQDEDRLTLLASPDRPNWPGIGVFVDRAGAGAPAIRATEESLQRQWLTCPQITFENGSLSHTDAQYVAVVQAGEILPPHALCVFADQAAKAGFPAALYADDDEIDTRLERHNPHFKPDAGPLFLSSGLLTRGVWLFRRDVLSQGGDIPTGTAGCLRLALALHVAGKGAASRSFHIPFVLSHRRTDLVQERAEDLLPVVKDFLETRHFAADIDAAAMPLRVTPDIANLQARGDVPRISIIIPTTARAPHVAACLDGILRHTRYPNVEIILVVSQAAPLDAEQERLLAPLRAQGKLQVHWLAAQSFSFSRAINFGVSVSDGSLVCLLNDDVVPLQDDWLWTLVGHLQDPEAGIVGPKLLYPDGTVQHGGVIMGLGGGCAHAHRLLPKDAPGYAFRACLDQDLSCVTGACLLVRRDVYDALDGLDESFPIAFNDIDFCLRARAAGWRVIYAASTTLLHYETISLGSHYEGERSLLQVSELRRLYERWHAAVMADPFHHPNLSLQMGHEWDTELPPRITIPFGLPRE